MRPISPGCGSEPPGTDSSNTSPRAVSGTEFDPANTGRLDGLLNDGDAAIKQVTATGAVTAEKLVVPHPVVRDRTTTLQVRYHGTPSTVSGETR